MKVKVDIIIAYPVYFFYKREMDLNRGQKSIFIFLFIFWSNFGFKPIWWRDLSFFNIGRIADDNIKATFVAEYLGKINIPDKGLLLWGLKAIFNIDEMLNLFINY